VVIVARPSQLNRLLAALLVLAISHKGSSAFSANNPFFFVRALGTPLHSASGPPRGPGWLGADVNDRAL
jgi:hypothetical protein